MVANKPDTQPARDWGRFTVNRRTYIVIFLVVLVGVLVGAWLMGPDQVGPERVGPPDHVDDPGVTPDPSGPGGSTSTPDGSTPGETPGGTGDGQSTPPTYTPETPEYSPTPDGTQTPVERTDFNETAVVEAGKGKGFIWSPYGYENKSANVSYVRQDGYNVVSMDVNGDGTGVILDSSVSIPHRETIHGVEFTIRPVARYSEDSVTFADHWGTDAIHVKIVDDGEG